MIPIGALAAISSSNFAKISSDNARRRRIGGISNDQILLKFNESKNRCIKEISKFKESWVARKNGISKPKPTFDFAIFLVIGMVSFLILFSIYMIWQMNIPWNESPPFGFEFIAVITLIISILSGFVLRYESEIEWLEFKDRGKFTHLLLRVYNSEGIRNINEDELDELLCLIENKLTFFNDDANHADLNEVKE